MRKGKSEKYDKSNANRKLRELKKKWKNMLKRILKPINSLSTSKAKSLLRTVPDYKLFKGLLRCDKALAQKLKDVFVQVFN